MKYTDVKLDQVFAEAEDPKHPKRTPRRVKVVALAIYSATCRVIAGRGLGHELSLPLKRLTDEAQWTLELPPVCPRCKGTGVYLAPGDFAPMEEFFCTCPAAKAAGAGRSV